MAANLKIIEVSAGIICRNGEILLARRPAGSHHAGCWEFPGGKLEDGETPESCLRRELLEELDLEIQMPRIVFEYEQYKDDDTLLRLYFIECCQVDGSFPKPVYGQKIVWSKPGGIPAYELLEPDRAAAEFLLKNFDNQGKV